MQINTNIAIWNANGIANHKLEVECFLQTNFIDLLLISESHLNSKTYFNIKGYDLVCANHPDDKAHGGAAILIKSTIKYANMNPIRNKNLQAAIIKVKSNNVSLTISAIYFPPRFSVSSAEYTNFFSLLGPTFIVAGDFNAKHPWWGSRLINPKGKALYHCITDKKYQALSTGRPTYWPADPNRIPDVIDFGVYNGIPSKCLSLSDCDNLSSDHSPLLLVYNTVMHSYKKPYKIINNSTYKNKFQNFLDEHIHLNSSFKTGYALDAAVETFTNLIHEAAFYLNTCQSPVNVNPNGLFFTSEIRHLIAKKRGLRKKWQNSRNENDKTILNKIIQELKQKLFDFKNECVGSYLRQLYPNNNNEYSLWKATKYIKRPTRKIGTVKNKDGIWCRIDIDKAEAFASHLKDVFQPFSFNSNSDNQEINHFLDMPCQMDLPISPIEQFEVEVEISKLNNRKSPGYDKIDARTIKLLTRKAIQHLTTIFNAILRLQHFPSQWKTAEIIVIKKPNKPASQTKSYRPISLLVTFSKIFEKIFLGRLLPILERKQIIPEHQFGFRHKHGTPEQCHRLVKLISDTLETKKYCSAVFLDVHQAFDKVWHAGILFKLKKLLPAPYYLFLKSYLTERHFYVKVGDEASEFYAINAGIPQGSVLGPVLYTIYTSDMPTSENVLIATYADDTAILASSPSADEASCLVQNVVNDIENWLKKWNMAVNSDKSTKVTFTMKRGDCPAIFINQKEIPKADSVKYLGMSLDRRLTWKDHVRAKREQLDFKTKKMYWLIGPKSELSLENKLLLYKTILKPVWTYGIQLWGTTSNSNVEILERYQAKVLRMIVNAPWFVNNDMIRRDLGMRKVKDEIARFSKKYLDRLSNHCNPIAIALLDDTDEVIRLRRHHLLDLPFRV